MKVLCTDNIKVTIPWTDRFPVLVTMMESTRVKTRAAIPLPFSSDVVSQLVSHKYYPVELLPALAKLADFLGDTESLAHIMNKLDKIGLYRPSMISQLPETLVERLSKVTRAVAGYEVSMNECVVCGRTQRILNLGILSVCEHDIQKLPQNMQFKFVRALDQIRAHHRCSKPYNLVDWDTNLPLCDKVCVHPGWTEGFPSIWINLGCAAIAAELERVFRFSLDGDNSNV